MVLSKHFSSHRQNSASYRPKSSQKLRKAGFFPSERLINSMEIPKPSFLRKPSLPIWPPPNPSPFNRKQPGRPMTLKDLRKEHKSPVSSSFFSSVPSSPRLIDISRLLDTTKHSKSKLESRSGLYSVNLVREKADSRRERKAISESIGGVIGKKLRISPTRVIIQIASKLPQRYQLKKSISQTQVSFLQRSPAQHSPKSSLNLHYPGPSYPI